MITSMIIPSLALVIDLPKQNRSWGKLPGLLLSDVILILELGFGLLLILALGMYLWKRLSRNRRRHISSGEKVFRESSGADNASGGPEEEEGDDEPAEEEDDNQLPSQHHNRRRYKYRARRRTHRSRNPTLSETGGLPPVKPQESGKPS